MKIRVDEIVKNAVERSSVPKQQIANKVGISRNWLREILESSEMEEKYIVAIGKIIRYDFSEHFPELKINGAFMATDSQETYKTLSNEELRTKIIQIQQRYIKLLEDHIDLLKQVNKTDQ